MPIFTGGRRDDLSLCRASFRLLRNSRRLQIFRSAPSRTEHVMSRMTSLYHTPHLIITIITSISTSTTTIIIIITTTTPPSRTEHVMSRITSLCHTHTSLLPSSPASVPVPPSSSPSPLLHLHVLSTSWAGWRHSITHHTSLLPSSPASVPVPRPLQLLWRLWQLQLVLLHHLHTLSVSSSDNVTDISYVCCLREAMTAKYWPRNVSVTDVHLTSVRLYKHCHTHTHTHTHAHTYNSLISLCSLQLLLTQLKFIVQPSAVILAAFHK